MARKLFDLQWWVPTGGFEWAGASPDEFVLRPRPVSLHKLGPGCRELPGRDYQPLQRHTALFTTFASVPPTKPDILTFADEYGALTRGNYIVDDNTRAQMKQVLAEIQDGTFARQWIAEYAAGNANYKAMKQADLDHPIEAIGKKLRANMKWLASSNPAPSKPATDAAQPQSEAA